jgi:predicted transcriptional regulator
MENMIKKGTKTKIGGRRTAIFTARLLPETLNRLQTHASKTLLSASACVELALREWLEKQEEKGN